MRYATMSKLAKVFKVSGQTAAMWNRKGKDFPAPAGYTDNGSRINRVWDISEVADWLIDREMGVIENQRKIRDKAAGIVESREQKVGEYLSIQSIAEKSAVTEQLIEVTEV